MVGRDTSEPNYARGDRTDLAKWQAAVNETRTTRLYPCGVVTEKNKKRRNFWPISPGTRIKESKKKYNRKKDTKTLGQYLKEKSDSE